MKKNPRFRYRFFITLRRINIVLFPPDKFLRFVHNSFPLERGFLVVETHMKGDSHYHLVLLLKDGVTKNNSMKILREFFEEKGVQKGIGIDIQGIISIKKPIKYITKDLLKEN